VSIITELALRGRVITILAMLLVVAGGAVALTRIQIELFPDIEFPLIAMIAPYPQANTDTVLKELTIPLESAVSGVGGLETISSATTAGISLVVAEFELGTSMDQVAAIVGDNLRALSLPAGVDVPRVTRVNPDEFPVLQFSVLWDSDPLELYDLVTTQVLPVAESVSGVFSAELPAGADAGTSVSRTNGEPSLSVSILKDPDANTVEVVDTLMERLDELKVQLPSGVEFVTVVNQAPRIKASIESLQREAALGAIFAVFVIFAFLLSVRPTLVIGVSIPTSILGGVLLMWWLGMSLNIMTLGGLAISVGRVVDDSIVVLENVYRHIQRGGNRVQATLAATREVARPITVSTLTTIAVFVPLGFIGGLIGSFFLPFAFAITYALLASLVVALTVVPVLGSIFIRPRSGGIERDSWLQRAYTPVIHWALHHKLLSISIAALLFAGSLGLLRFIPQTFFPSSGAALLTVEVTLPRGTPPDIVLAEVRSVEETMALLRRGGVVDTFHVTVGSGSNVFSAGGGDLGSPNTGNFFVVLMEDADARETAELLREELSTSQGVVIVGEVQGGGPASDAVELTLTGTDYELAVETAVRIAAVLQGMDGLINVSTDAPEPNDGPLGAAEVSRVNGQRAVTISGSITDVNTQKVNRAVLQVVAEVGLPAGVELKPGGVFEDIEEAFKDMGIAMFLAIVLVYLVMVVSMRSFMIPVIITLSLPLASMGAFGALFITGRTLGLPALIGILMLIGLVVTNAIVLIAFVEQLRAGGMPVYDALVEGGRTRLRPILMTAFTTSFALLPLAIIVSEGGIFGVELATVVIGGLMTATFLTLIVLPVVYSLLRRPGEPKVPLHLP
jgi:multidrug efflux pump subunit AcrB